MENYSDQRKSSPCCSSAELKHLKDKFEYRISNVGLYEAILRLEELSPSLHELWGLLYHRANIFNHTINIDKAELAKTCRNVSIRTIERNISLLIEDGWLERRPKNDFFVSIPKRIYKHVKSVCSVRRAPHSTPVNENKNYVHDESGALLYSTRENPDGKLVIIIEKDVASNLGDAKLKAINNVLLDEPIQIATVTPQTIKIVEPIVETTLEKLSDNNKKELNELKEKLCEHNKNTPTGMMAKIAWSKELSVLKQQISALESNEIKQSPLSTATPMSQTTDTDVATPLINKPCTTNHSKAHSYQQNRSFKQTQAKTVNAAHRVERIKNKYSENKPHPLPQSIVKAAEKAVCETYRHKCSNHADVTRQVLWAVSRLFAGRRRDNINQDLQGNLTAALKFIEKGEWREPAGYDGIVPEYPVKTKQGNSTNDSKAPTTLSKTKQFIKDFMNTNYNQPIGEGV